MCGRRGLLSPTRKSSDQDSPSLEFAIRQTPTRASSSPSFSRTYLFDIPLLHCGGKSSPRFAVYPSIKKGGTKKHLKRQSFVTTVRPPTSLVPSERGTYRPSPSIATHAGRKQESWRRLGSPHLDTIEK